ncbi:proteinase-activated receptor 4 [Dasypus novemcinctus]|uniref:proteinase-activated receptor 4 n=1 Tax=Dasypus novemcinctus TaxID=9361 RepID=UPI00265F53A6|nr:proteinase-activated receptor 4 [Dasypus novemcinctus]
MRWLLLLLLGPRALGLGLAGSPRTPSLYDEAPEDSSPAGGDGGPRGGPFQRSFPGQRSANDSGVLELPERQRALLLGWPVTRLVPALYGLAVAVGLPANALALWVLAARRPRPPSALLLMNLAAADLLLGLALPPRLAYHARGLRWPFGEAACRLSVAALYGHMYASLLLLAAVSLDRYLALARPLRARALRGRPLAAGLCAAAWVAAAALALPLALQRQSFRLAGSDRTVCHDALPGDAQAAYWRPAFACLALLGCCAPLLAMLLCHAATLRALAADGARYGRARRLTALVLASAVAFFAPSNALLLLHYSDPGPDAWGPLYAAYLPCLALSCLNSCVDPFVYYYVSAEFRHRVRAALRWGARPGVAASAAGADSGPSSGTRSSSLL